MPDSAPKKSPLGAPPASRDLSPDPSKSKAVAQVERSYSRSRRRATGGLTLMLVLKRLVLLLLIGTAAYAGWWNYLREDPEYRVTDKLLIPGNLLSSHERTALGYRKAAWVEPKFVLTLEGSSTGREQAFEVPERLFLHIPRNTYFSKNEVAGWVVFVSPELNRKDPGLLIGLSRFSTSSRSGFVSPATEEPTEDGHRGDEQNPLNALMKLLKGG